jgi:hypothetical protein
MEKKITYLNLNLKDFLIIKNYMTKAEIGKVLCDFAEHVVIGEPYESTEKNRALFSILEDSLKKTQNYSNRRSKKNEK